MEKHMKEKKETRYMCFIVVGTNYIANLSIESCIYFIFNFYSFAWTISSSVLPIFLLLLFRCI